MYILFTYLLVDKILLNLWDHWVLLYISSSSTYFPHAWVVGPKLVNTPVFSRALPCYAQCLILCSLVEVVGSRGFRLYTLQHESHWWKRSSGPQPLDPGEDWNPGWWQMGLEQEARPLCFWKNSCCVLKRTDVKKTIKMTGKYLQKYGRRLMSLM